MATFTSNSYSGRYLQLTITETINTAANKSTLKWTLTSTGGSSLYYSIAPTTVKINGTQVYYKGATDWSDKVFPAATGSVSGTIDVTHNSDGKKSISVVFDTRVWYSSAESYGGTMTLANIDRSAPSVSLSCSNITASSVKLTITSSATANRWWYSLNGGSSWKEFNSTDGTKKEITVTGLTPNTSYKIQACARKKTNNVDGYSSTATIKTLGGSVISSVSTFTADNATAKLTLSVTVYNTSYTHTLVIKNGATSILTISSLKLANGSNTITLTAAQRSTVLKAMSKIKSFTGTFELKTFSGSTQIGNASSKTATIQTTAANSAPTFPGFTYEDSNATAAGVTGNNQILIQGISTLKITAQAATAKNEAAISSYSVVAGNATASGTTPTINVGTIATTGTVPVIVTAVDTRGYTTSVTVNITVLKYERIDISNYSMRRINEVEDATQAAIKGNITPVTIGSVNKNALKYLRYRYKKTSDEQYSSYYDITAKCTHNANSFSFESQEWLSIDANYSYYVQFTVADKLTTDTVTITVPQGTPLLSFRRKKVGVNKREPNEALDIEGNISVSGKCISPFYPQGGIFPIIINSSTDLNTLITPGIYAGGNANLINAPVAGGMIFSLEIYRAGSASSSIQKITYVYDSGIRRFERYRVAGSDVWTDWRCTADTRHKVLWSSAGWYMKEGQDITLPEPISQQANGIVLTFAPYYVSSNETSPTAKTWDNIDVFVSKRLITGSVKDFPLAVQTFSMVGIKKLTIKDTQIIGNDTNKSSGITSGIHWDNSKFVLTKVTGC